MTDEVKTVVIDNGSGMCKAGFAGADAPSSVFPTIVKRANDSQEKPSKQHKDIFVGHEATGYSLLKPRNPYENGIITNWDDMEKIYDYIFSSELHIDPKEHPVLLTEIAQDPKSNREKIIQLLFETYKVQSFYLGNQAVLSLISTGRDTGIVLESGDSVTQIVPVYELFSIPHASKIHKFGGRDLTTYLSNIYKRENSFDNGTENDIVRDIKEKHAYVALDYDAELQKFNPASLLEHRVEYVLPDGNLIIIKDECIRCPEILFKPNLNGFKFDGIDHAIIDSIMKCNADLHTDLYSNIVLSGGNTLFNGLPERFEKEIIQLAPSTMKVNVVAQPERKNGAWIGGSIFASQAIFPQMVITQEEYDDIGPIIVHRKCL